MTTTFQPPTPVVEFDARVNSSPYWGGAAALANCIHTLTAEQQKWFCEHVEIRTRWKHANDVAWRDRLKDKATYGLYWYIDIVDRWAEEFVASPDGYRRRYPHEMWTPPTDG